MNLLTFLILLTKIVSSIFLVVVCILQIIIFIEFIYKYKQKTSNKQPEFHLFENVIYLFVFVNVWIIYFNSGFSLSGSFLSPYDEFGLGIIRLLTVAPEDIILFFTFLYGVFLILSGLVLLYFPITIINFFKSVIKREFNDEVSELKTAVSMIIISSFTAILVLQTFVRLSY